MSRSNQNKWNVLKEKLLSVRDWIMDHSKIVMPLVLVVCVFITIFIAVNANQREALEQQAQQAAMDAQQSEQVDVSSLADLAAPEFPLEENAYPEVNHLVNAYYTARAEGDIEKVAALNPYLDKTEIMRVQALSKYIDSYPQIDVYTKPGLSENSYVAYVCSEVKFSDVDVPLPGMQTYYVGLDEAGEYFLVDSTKADTTERSYIDKVTLQDDVVDLNNKITVEYNELLVNNEEVNEFMAYLYEKINEEVGEILAETEQADQPAETVAEAEAEASPAPVTVVQKVRTTDVVNIRKSDSEEADRIDKAQAGQEFELLEQRGNGWSMISYNGGAAFIKSDYLEVVSSVTVEEPEQDGENGAQENDQSEPQQAADEGNNKAASGTVKVKENVRVRASASTEADILGTAYVGEELELLMVQADGWTRVKYKGNTAYVKSEYVE